MSSAVEEVAVATPQMVSSDTTHADKGDANDGSSSSSSSSDDTRTQIPQTPQTPQTPRLEYRNNANLVAPVRVDVAASPALRDQQVTRAVRLVRPDLFANDRPSHTYASVSHAHRITIRQLGGGLSNHLYVAHPGGREEAVLVRIHAEDEEVEDSNGEEADAGSDGAHVCAASSSASAPTFVDREVENRVLAWLSSEGLAPTFHGRFANGRVEEFYDGFRPLSWDELRLRRFAVPVARALANLHCAHPPEGVLNISEEQRNKGEIWSRISEWFDMATNASSDTEANELMQTMKVEWEWLQATLRPSSNGVIMDSASTMKCFDLKSHSGNVQSAASSYFRQIVFTHMDCQSLNILTPCEGFHLDDDSSDIAPASKDEGNVQAAESKPEENDLEEGKGGEYSYASVRLIDFEYAGVNPRAADIANTFSEYCNMNNLEPDYEVQYPTSGQQDVFLRAYIETASPELAKQLDQFKDGWASFLSAARVEIGQHTLLSHIGWGIWAIAQESLSNIEFDYLRYARLRLEGYFHFKDRYFDEPAVE